MKVKEYYIIYHYSQCKDLEFIDPAHYGTCVTRGTECKRGKNGLNKSYYYTIDEPEDALKYFNRYEIYLPCNWKDKIYDIGHDTKNFRYGNIGSWNTIQEKNEQYEQSLIENGYKGIYNPLSALPHAICLYHKLSTRRPKPPYIAYDWEGRQIEDAICYKDMNSRSYKTFLFTFKNKNINFYKQFPEWYRNQVYETAVKKYGLTEDQVLHPNFSIWHFRALDEAGKRYDDIIDLTPAQVEAYQEGAPLDIVQKWEGWPEKVISKFFNEYKRKGRWTEESTEGNRELLVAKLG